MDNSHYPTVVDYTCPFHGLQMRVPVLGIGTWGFLKVLYETARSNIQTGLTPQFLRIRSHWIDTAHVGATTVEEVYDVWAPPADMPLEGITYETLLEQGLIPANTVELYHFVAAHEEAVWHHGHIVTLTESMDEFGHPNFPCAGIVQTPAGDDFCAMPTLLNFEFEDERPSFLVKRRE